MDIHFRSTNVTDSHAEGHVTSIGNLDTYAGGLVGYSSLNNVLNCYATGDVSSENKYSSESESHAGGLVGKSYGSITDSYATGHVSNTVLSNDGATGGLLGYITEDLTISNCSATGDVTSNDRDLGGLIGASASSNITDSFATGDVSTNVLLLFLLMQADS